MSEGMATVSYIGATILFILSLGGLSNPETSRRGNLYGMIGMALAVVAPAKKGHGHGAGAPMAARTLTIMFAVAAIMFWFIGAYAPTAFLGHFTVFVLACFVGYMVVWNVTPALHTPLMSVTNAISSIIIIGAIVQIAPPVLAGEGARPEHRRHDGEGHADHAVEVATPGRLGVRQPPEAQDEEDDRGDVCNGDQAG